MNNIPCKDPENDPDDWFIGINGKQYSDDEFVTEEQVVAHLDEVDPHGTRSTEIILATWDRLEVEEKKAALQRRRRARDACFSCDLRTHCLDIAIQQQIPHGTWGGYFEEQIRELRREMNRRSKRTL